MHVNSPLRQAQVYSEMNGVSIYMSPRGFQRLQKVALAAEPNICRLL